MKLIEDIRVDENKVDHENMTIRITEEIENVPINKEPIVDEQRRPRAIEPVPIDLEGEDTGIPHDPNADNPDIPREDAPSFDKEDVPLNTGPTEDVPINR